jgi:hypothetical protein
LVVISLAFIYGCGSAASSGGGGSSGGSVTIVPSRAGTYEYAGTMAPGDVWSWIISPETFWGSNETTGAYITGEWVTLSNAFGRLHVIGASIIDAVEKYAYFIEYPGTALIVVPVGESKNAIVCAARSDTHLSGPSNYVWLKVPGTGEGTPADTAYGTAEATWASDDATFHVIDYNMNGSFTHEGTGSLTFDASTGMLKGSGPESMLLTPSGIFIVDNGPGAGGAIGASLESFSSFEAAEHEYRGLVFQYWPSGTSESGFIAATPGTTLGTMKGYQYTDNDPASGINASRYVTFSFITQESTGIVSIESFDAFGEGESANFRTTIKSVFAKVGTGSSNKYIWFGRIVNWSGRPEIFMLMQTDD